MSPSLEIRALRTNAEYAECLQLQKETWGPAFNETVPAAILRVTQKIGGIAAAAFEDGRMVGFVFGMTGIESGRPVHWSDMLAVRASHRNRGIGEQLKWYQRARLLERDVTRMYWTFDPLDAKNAYLNFERLGVIAREYVVDMYGKTESPLHAGSDTDRLIAIWDLTSERVRAKAAGTASPPLSYDAFIEIPADIHALNKQDPAAARGWRMRTRAQFSRMLATHVVTGLVREQDRARYALTAAAFLAR